MDSFSLINDPRNEYGKLYTVDKLGNVWGGRPVLCTSFHLSILRRRQLIDPQDVNTEIDNLKATVVKLIKAGVPVFFGCHVGRCSDSTIGVMDLKLFDYEVRTHSLVARVNLNWDQHRPLSISISA